MTYLLYFCSFFVVYLCIGLVIIKMKRKDKKQGKWLGFWDAIGWAFLIFIP
jgi:uncharacterized membrane protein SirB2